jgi:hypothetical protein
LNININPFTFERFKISSHERQGSNNANGIGIGNT